MVKTSKGIRVFSGLPIKWKLMTMIILTTFTITSCFALGYAFYEYRLKATEFRAQIATLMKVVGLNSTAAIVFQDPETASEILEALAGEPLVVSAQIFSPTGELFSQYISKDPVNQALLESKHLSAPSPPIIDQGYALSSGDVLEATDIHVGVQFMYLQQPIVVNDRIVATIMAQVSKRSLRALVKRQISTFIAIATIALILSFILASRFQRMISTPIISLANAIRSVSKDQDYSLRVEEHNSDELGELIDGFNDMLSQIDNRDKALEIAKDEAEAANSMKSQFLANMSHEIRTPMNGVLGMTDLLSGTRLDEKQHHYVHTIHESGKALLGVINDILDFSKIEAGELKLEATDLNLQELVTQTFELIADQAFNKGLELIWHIDDDVPIHLVGDAIRLRQVLLNLLGNAIKFTAMGEVMLSISPIFESDNKIKLQFALRDTGIGIEKEKLNRIFDAFSQADLSTTRRFGGTGLGLSISAQLVEMMGGEISVKSQLGKGSTFTFTIEFGKQRAQPVAFSHDVDLSGKKILIVDDNASNREILCQQTSTWGIDAEQAKDAAEALKKLKIAAQRSESYSLAILDLIMPVTDGMELAECVRTDPQIKATPLVLLTSGSQDIDVENAEAQWFSCVLRKPVSPSDLYACLKRALVSSDEINTSSQHKSSRNTATPQFPAKILVVEDNPVNQVVARDILSLYGCEAYVVGDGKQAVKAAQNSHYDLILMDIQMPYLDGVSATAEIRNGTANADVPIIALTANAMGGDRELYIEKGMSDYLSKPFDRNKLLGILEKWLSPTTKSLDVDTKKTSADDIHRPDNSTDAHDTALPHIPNAMDKTPAQVDISLDSPFDHETIEMLKNAYGDNFDNKWAVLGQMYMESASKDLEKIRNAIEGSDAAALYKAAHSLKSSSGNMGAKQMMESCRRLENKAREGSLADVENDLKLLETHYSQVLNALPTDTSIVT